MAAGNFSTCLAITDRWEGGYVDHPADPGGKTYRGVTQGTYDDWRRRWKQSTRSVRMMSRDERIRIYREGYWNAVGADTLAPGVDLATFDAGVNSGPSRGRKWLLASIGGADHVTVKKICAKRLGFVRALRTWASFGRGWTNRIVDIEAKGVAMALATVNDDAVVAQQLDEEASAANSRAKKQQAGAGGAGAGGAGAGGAGGAATQLDPAAADQLAGWIIGGCLVVGLVVAGYLVWRAIVNNKRAAAYAAAAMEIAP